MATITTSKVETTPADSKAVGEKGVSILSRLREIAAVEKAARDLKDEKAALAAELAELAGNAKYLTFHGGVIATRIDSKSTGIDRKMLAEAWPEAYEATYTETPYSYYRQA